MISAFNKYLIELQLEMKKNLCNFFIYLNLLLPIYNIY
jgi:hypothetical protein